MKPRQIFFKQKKEDKDLIDLIKKIEKDEIKLIKLELPGKNDDTMRYMRPWKL